jgi:hypothetical protein
MLMTDPKSDEREKREKRRRLAGTALPTSADKSVDFLLHELTKADQRITEYAEYEKAESAFMSKNGVLYDMTFIDGWARVLNERDELRHVRNVRAEVADAKLAESEKCGFAMSAELESLRMKLAELERAETLTEEQEGVIARVAINLTGGLAPLASEAKKLLAIISQLRAAKPHATGCGHNMTQTFKLDGKDVNVCLHHNCACKSLQPLPAASSPCTEKEKKA